MNPVFNKFVIFYENGSVHHARLDTKGVYEDNKAVIFKNYRYADEVEKEIAKIMNEFHIYDLEVLKNMGLVVYVDYKKLSEKEKKQEDNFRKYRRGEDFDKTKFAQTLYSIDDITAKVNRKLAKYGLSIKKLLILAAAGVVLAEGIHLADVAIDNHAKYAFERTKSVANMVLQDEKVDKDELTDLIRLMDGINSDDPVRYDEAMSLSQRIFDSYKVEGYFFENVITRFTKLGGLKDIRRMSKSEIEHLCIYTTNLLFGGDNYSFLYNGASGYIASGLALREGYDYTVFVNGLAEKYHISTSRVEYSAVPAEGDAFDKLPPLVRFVILSKCETAVKKVRFEFENYEKPSWWAENRTYTYNYDLILERIEIEKEKCLTELYANYSNSKNR